ncbi:MAG: hypothetical protein HFF39_08755 [Lawsonibacter sp.]|nr:hypothetical protein [Lawsonibacter sp.]
MRQGWRKLAAGAMSLALALSAALGAAPAARASGAVRFSDVNEQDWFYSFVTDLSGQGIVSGYPDGRFQPYENVKVGECLSLVLMAAGHDLQPATEEHWASGFADYAVRAAYLPSVLREDLDREMTRLEVAQLAAKALKLVPPKGVESPFADTEDGYANVLFQKGILSGSMEGEARVFKPGEPVTRAEISAIVWNMRNTDVHQGQIETEFYYVDVLEEVPASTLDPQGFQVTAGRADYFAPGVETRHGVDVASFQGDIDWERVKADGIDFAIIRVGGRGLTEGALYDDKKFEENIQGALAAGVEVGAYFFSQAVTVEEAREEAEYLLEKLAPYRRDITCPVVFDWEDMNIASYRGYRLDYNILGECARTFCGMVEEAGYQPMIYFNRFGGYRSYDLRQVMDYPFWFAQYLETTQFPTFHYDIAMWQYSSKGQVDGIPAAVDMNLYFIKE